MSLIKVSCNGFTSVRLLNVFVGVASVFCSHRSISPATLAFSSISPTSSIPLLAVRLIASASYSSASHMQSLAECCGVHRSFLSCYCICASAHRCVLYSRWTLWRALHLLPWLLGVPLVASSAVPLRSLTILWLGWMRVVTAAAYIPLVSYKYDCRRWLTASRSYILPRCFWFASGPLSAFVLVCATHLLLTSLPRAFVPSLSCFAYIAFISLLRP